MPEKQILFYRRWWQDRDRALVTIFRRRGYEPIATANPSIVEQTLANFEVQLILLDLRMERLNGYDVLRIFGAKHQDAGAYYHAYYDDEKKP